MAAEREPVQLFTLAEVPVHSLAEWARASAAALASGGSLCSLYGRTLAEGQILVTAIVLGEGARMQVLRGLGLAREAYPSLTAGHPAAQMAERELWEQTGLIPAGHPWLKPVRYEGQRQAGMQHHPFFSVRGHDIHEVGVGPIHASVIEPGHFRFMCHGEKVHHLEIQLGYQHRGLEALALQRPPWSLSTLFETVAGDSSIAYVWGHCAALESLSATAPDVSTERLRGMALEMERIAMHLSTLTGMTTDIAFLQGGATLGRLRTAIINATMRACGSRFGRGWIRPGGVRFGFDEVLRKDWIGTLEAFAADFDEVCRLILTSHSVRSRLMGVGRLSLKAAMDLGIVGLAARASGLSQDWRQSHAGELYTRHPVPVCVEDSGDCWARLRLRMREIDVSTQWLLALLREQTIDLSRPAFTASGAPGASAVATPKALQPLSLAVSLREGFRGPVLHAVETDAGGRIIHYKIQDPSFWNWFGAAISVRDNEISDFPICNKSFDLSYCGNDL